MAPSPKSAQAQTPRRPGRPQTQHIPHIDATPEEVAQAMFAAVKPPDTSKRLTRKQQHASTLEEEYS